MRKALVITSVASMIDQFLMPSVCLLKDMGYQVHVACNFEKGNSCPLEKIIELKNNLKKMSISFFQIDFERNPAKLPGLLGAYRQVKKIVTKHKYDLVHCHSPVGGFVTRLACRKARKLGTRVFYTAHGFHFYSGAPLKNWLLYYPAERLCAHYTDLLITINAEDYHLARQKMKAKRVEYVPGVGIDIDRFTRIDVNVLEKRKEIGVPENATLLLSVGELNCNKNHETVIRAIKNLDIHYIIAGQGDMRDHLQSVISELGLTNRVKLLGVRSDIAELCCAADAFAFPSFREGLSVSIMEAMASGLPVACSRIRGNIDLIDQSGGVFFDPHSVTECRDAIKSMLEADLSKMSAHNREKVKKYSQQNILVIMKSIYEGT